MELHQELDAVLRRPRNQRRADRSSAVEYNGIGAWQLDWTSDPPAAPRRRIERSLTVTIVAQDPDLPRKTTRGLRFGDGLDEQLLEARNSCFIRARLLRQIEKLIAVIERENEQLLTRRPRRRNAMQSRQRCILVGARNLLRVGEKIIELDSRRHRRRVAVPRHDQRGAGVGVTLAGIVMVG